MLDRNRFTIKEQVKIIQTTDTCDTFDADTPSPGQFKNRKRFAAPARYESSPFWRNEKALRSRAS